jgi:predicted NAD/FAD-binding protein
MGEPVGFNAASTGRPRRIAVVGSGIAGMSCAWLLSQGHDVTLFEADDRIGGHSHTQMAAGVAVDTGFIVFNPQTYPNLCALFENLGVATLDTEMTFAVSLDRTRVKGGRLEYSGTDLGGIFAQKRNLVSPRYWSMLRDLARFYMRAPKDLPTLGDETLGAYLDRLGCGRPFREDHLYPMAAAIWSSDVGDIPNFPAASFVRFCENHGLLKFSDRPTWRTVKGGSGEYVAKITAPYADSIRRNCPVRSIRRDERGVTLVSASGEERFDDVVIATHADQALALLTDADADERRLLGAIHYRRNHAVLHSDPALMPARRRVWSSWNYASDSHGTAHNSSRGPALSVTYWMNRLQHIPDATPLFVTLNPVVEPDPALVHARMDYEHPLLDTMAVNAQRQLWSLQGRRRAWFCGAHFGAGFHEDGLQSGLAVAEQLGGIARPWRVAQPSGRIVAMPLAIPQPLFDSAPVPA